MTAKELIGILNRYSEDELKNSTVFIDINGKENLTNAEWAYMDSVGDLIIKVD